MKKPEPKVPEACIRDGAEGRTPICGRFLSLSDYLFQDAARAVKLYAEGKFLRACPSCVKEFRARAARAAAAGGAT